MAQPTFYKYLSQLKERKLILAKKVNKRDQSLHLNRDNLVTVSLLELHVFETAYFVLLDKVFEMIKKPPSWIKLRRIQLAKMEPHPEGDFLVFAVSQYELLMSTIHLFQTMVKIYFFKLSLMWATRITNNDLLIELHDTVHHRIADCIKNLT